MDSDAADIAVAQLDLAGVQPRPKLDADASQLVAEGAGAADGPAGPSKVARMPSPVVFTSLPPNSLTSRRASSSWTFSTAGPSLHRRVS
jgi:hypothetical protein